MHVDGMQTGGNPQALVTGATGAIGNAIARALAERGFNLTLVVRDRTRGERVSIQKVIHHPNMLPFPTQISWELPAWFSEGLVDSVLADDNAKMAGAIDLARSSIEHGGGPFAALVIDRTTNSVIAAAANQVLEGNCSLLHAETLALAAAQARIQRFTLADGDYELVSSSEPCVQCLGAIFWSGIGRLVCGALVEDAEVLGFDEGPRRDDWQDQLLARSIHVTTGVLRREASAVLQEYVERGGVIYNARSR